MFEDQKMKSEISTSQFLEDVSGETLIFNKHVLSQECAKTTSETTSFDIPILMRMSRARASFLKRRQIRKLTQHLHVLRMSRARASFLTNDVVKRILQHPHVWRMSQARASLLTIRRTRGRSQHRVPCMSECWAEPSSAPAVRDST